MLLMSGFCVPAPALARNSAFEGVCACAGAMPPPGACAPCWSVSVAALPCAATVLPARPLAAACPWVGEAVWAAFAWSLSASSSAGGALPACTATAPRSEASVPSSYGVWPPNGWPLPEVLRLITFIGEK